MDFYELVIIGIVGSFILFLFWIVFVIFGTLISIPIQAILSLFKRVFSNKR
jgi:hypothetical protein